MMHTEKLGSLVKFITCMTSCGRDLVWHVHRHRTSLGEARRKTARLGKLEIARCRHTCICKYTSDISRARIFEWCAHRAKSLLPDVTHMMNFTQLPCFSVCIIEKLGGAWVAIKLQAALNAFKLLRCLKSEHSMFTVSSYNWLRLVLDNQLI